MLSTSTAKRGTKITYLIFRIVAVYMLINQLFMLRWGNVVILLLALFLFAVPWGIEKFLKIEIPDLLEVIFMSFAFSVTILGEFSDFYAFFSF